MAATKAHSKLVQEMTEAGSKLLESLSPDQKIKACFEYLDGERIFWY